ncbi:alanine racemase [Sporosarcina sp. HYO08]|uniref:alanine racemase n=1 Tax=Sporosarcina sp. HYO08 TaxID=1759557 RepID=UPI00079584B5|nr:alanine racemase [Sporosarcina sp. HYO08]KXH80949.1 alanine racemase [Sporosarcina sp. HYO08]
MKNFSYFRPSKAIIQLEAIRNNVRNLKSYLGNEKFIIAVVKADGYGNGAVEVARAAFQAGAHMVSVATPDEAIELREAGIVGDILVMGPSPTNFAPTAAELDIIVTVSGAEWVTSAIQNNDSFGKPLKIHVKIDSGMGRIGLRETVSLHALIEVINHSKDIVLDGIFTHFARADEEDANWTEEQFKKFMEIVQSLPEKPRLVHAANSAATLLYPHISLDAVRFGISLYGIAPSRYVEEKLPFPLERSMTLESELAFVKLLPAGEPISYGGTYKTSEDEWIGTIPIGYADGLSRGLRGQEVLIGGKRVPIVGTIAMDQCMVKLPHEMPVGERVVLIGRQGDEEITMEEWADRLGTIPYEITVSISKRVPRIYED